MIMKISGGQFLTVNFFLSVTYFPVKVPYILQIEQAAGGGGGRNFRFNKFCGVVRYFGTEPHRRDVSMLEIRTLLKRKFKYYFLFQYSINLSF